jgi:hypothetical protein
MLIIHPFFASDFKLSRHTVVMPLAERGEGRRRQEAGSEWRGEGRGEHREKHQPLAMASSILP